MRETLWERSGYSVYFYQCRLNYCINSKYGRGYQENTSRYEYKGDPILFLNHRINLAP